MRQHRAMIAVLAIAGCGTTNNNEASIDVFPAALRGCWSLDPEVGTDQSEIIEIGKSSINVVASWMKDKSVIVTADHIKSSTATAVQGRFSWREGQNRATYATEIGLGIRGFGSNQLTVVEGDAGSRFFSRCKKEKPQ